MNGVVNLDEGRPDEDWFKVPEDVHLKADPLLFASLLPQGCILVEADMVVRRVLDSLSSMKAYLQLPRTAKKERRRDIREGLADDPGIERATSEAIEWLCRAQDNSTSHDGGVARHYSLLTGWGPSYPETTGYIIPTLLAYAKLRENASLFKRAKVMLDWLVSIQLPCGGFQGGTINEKPVVPVTFNTGQILFGLANGVREFGEDYRSSLRAAADWLVVTQDSDGCWRRHPTPFAEKGEKTYETHVAWGLLEAARVEPSRSYIEAALRSLNWSMGKQASNGWFEDCCLSDSTQALSHTLGYALRGFIEAYRFSREQEFLDASLRAAEGLLSATSVEGFLPGRLDPQWEGTVRWACLTGTVQVAHCWLLLYQETGDRRFRDAGFKANRYVRRTMRLDGPPETRGAIKGSFPISGEYGQYEYLNWACKFLIDSNLLEQIVRNEE